MANDYLNRLLNVGERALTNLADKATLGNEAAARIRMAEEAEYYARLNGSGPYEPRAALREAKAGSPYWRDPLGAIGGGGFQGGHIVIFALLVGVGWLLFRK